jgi:hypothetical protein
LWNALTKFNLTAQYPMTSLLRLLFLCLLALTLSSCIQRYYGVPQAYSGGYYGPGQTSYYHSQVPHGDFAMTDQNYPNEVGHGNGTDEEARRINAEVDAVFAGRHNPLPAAQQVRADPYARVAQMDIQNDTGLTLTVQYSGPTKLELVLRPHEMKTTSLVIGTYKVAAKVNSPTVWPYAGYDRLAGGQYSNKFYIETVRR